MAGHSKWANIQHRKGRQDAKRGRLFTKLIREITVSAKLGGGDPDANPRLRAAIDSALSNNMSRDTIVRAIRRGDGDDESANVNEVRYEGYGPSGVAVMVDCMTDNKNRTVAEVRHVFSKFGGNLGTDGSVAYLFTKLGLIRYPPATDEDALIETALEAGAEDVVHPDRGSFEVLTTPDSFSDIKQSLDQAGLQASWAGITMKASTTVCLALDEAQKLLKLIDALEDLDDVQQVYSSAEISDDILAQLE